MTKQKTSRINLRVTPEQQRKLKKLSRATGNVSMTETVRRALVVYEYLWKVKKQNGRVVIVDKDGNKSDLTLL